LCFSQVREQSKHIVAPFENATPINQNKKGQNKRVQLQSRLIGLIRVVFLNGAMLTVSDKYYSVNERTQEISELMKLHILGAWQNAHKFVRQLVH